MGGRLEAPQEERRAQRCVGDHNTGLCCAGGTGTTCPNTGPARAGGKSLRTEQDFGILKESIKNMKSFAEDMGQSVFSLVVSFWCMVVGFLWGEEWVQVPLCFSKSKIFVCI